MPPPDHQQTHQSPGTATVPPPPPAPTPAAPAPADPANHQRAVAALFIALLSLAGLLGLNDIRRGVYIVMFALLAGGVALWMSLTAIQRARRSHTRRPAGSGTAIVIAGIGIAVSSLMLLTFAMLGPQLSSYEECLSGAGTTSARHYCQSQFSRAVSHRLTVLRGNPLG